MEVMQEQNHSLVYIKIVFAHLNQSMHLKCIYPTFTPKVWISNQVLMYQISFVVCRMGLLNLVLRVYFTHLYNAHVKCIILYIKSAALVKTVISKAVSTPFSEYTSVNYTRSRDLH